MLRRILITAAIILVATASPALAGGDDYTPPSIQATPNADNSATLTGQNFVPNTPYTYTVTYQGPFGIRPIQAVGDAVDSGDGTIEADGTFTDRTAILPAGRYLVTVESGGLVATTTLALGDGAAAGNNLNQGDDQAQGSNLAQTGTDSSIPMARLGVILVAAGGVAVYAGKKRKGRREAFTSV